MTTFLLIRHGHTEAVGSFVAGRRPGLGLTDRGRQEAEALGRWLDAVPVNRLLASPLERAQETAAILARHLRCAVETEEAILEVEFGEWTGRTYADLSADPAWKIYNRQRGAMTIPGGERVISVQDRVVNCLLRLAEESPSQTLALVSHGDAIRAAITFFLGIPVDFFQRFEILPASVSILQLGPESPPRILGLNAGPSVAMMPEP